MIPARFSIAIAVALSLVAAADVVRAAGPAGAVAPYRMPAPPAPCDKPAGRCDWPAWRESMEHLQWKRIPGSDLPSVVADDGIPGKARNIIDAWNGLAADIRTNRLYSAANGGHADYAGNGVYALDLSADEPRWKELRAPTAKADILASDYNAKAYHDYYEDGRPASTHTYYGLQFLASRNAIFKFGAGSLWGTGNEANWHTDAFSLAQGDWQPAGSWPEVVPGSRAAVTSASVCMNPSTDEVFVASPGRLRKFDPQSGSYVELARWPDNSTAVAARGCAVDTRRNRVVFFGDAYREPKGGLLYDPRDKRLKRIVFEGEGVKAVTARAYNFAWYDPGLDRFLVKTKAGGTVYSVHPEKFSVEKLPTRGESEVPDAANGVHSRWQRLPLLGGYAYYPRAGSGVWFLAVDPAGR